MNKYEKLAEKIAENLEFNDLIESFIYFKAKSLEEEPEEFERMKDFYEEESESQEEEEEE